MVAEPPHRALSEVASLCVEDRPTSLVGRMVLVLLEPARDLVVRSSLVKVVNVALRDKLLPYPRAVP